LPIGEISQQIFFHPSTKPIFQKIKNKKNLLIVNGLYSIFKFNNSLESILVYLFNNKTFRKKRKKKKEKKKISVSGAREDENNNLPFH